MLLSLCASLEGREEAEGKSISPLGAEREAFRDVFGLRWAKRQLPLPVGSRRIADTLYVYLILLLSPCASLEEREEDEEESRSSLGAEQGAFRDCFGLG